MNLPTAVLLLLGGHDIATVKSLYKRAPQKLQLLNLQSVGVFAVCSCPPTVLVQLPGSAPPLAAVGWNSAAKDSSHSVRQRRTRTGGNTFPLLRVIILG